MPRLSPERSRSTPGWKVGRPRRDVGKAAVQEPGSLESTTQKQMPGDSGRSLEAPGVISPTSGTREVGVAALPNLRVHGEGVSHTYLLSAK